MQLSKSNKISISIICMLVLVLAISACFASPAFCETKKVSPFEGTDGWYKVPYVNKDALGPSWMSDQMFEDYVIVIKKGDAYTLYIVQKNNRSEMNNFKLALVDSKGKPTGEKMSAKEKIYGSRRVHMFENLDRNQLDRANNFTAIIPAMAAMRPDGVKIENLKFDFANGEKVPSDYLHKQPKVFTFPTWGYFVIAGVAVVVIAAAIVIPIVVIKVNKKKKALVGASTEDKKDDEVVINESNIDSDADSNTYDKE